MLRKLDSISCRLSEGQSDDIRIFQYQSRYKQKGNKMSKKKTEDYVVEVSDVFESSGDWLDDIIEALNDRGIQAYVYKKEKSNENETNI
jgi:hypothetical protein